MNLVFRLLWVLLRAALGERRHFMEPSVLRLRVLPNDVDLNFHMTNARYFSVMDLGRVDMLARGGLIGMMVKRKRQAVLGASTIRFRRPLAPLQAYVLRSHVVCWNDRRLYIEQRIEALTGEEAATAVMECAFIDGNGVVSPARILAELGESRLSPPFPDHVTAMRPQNP